MHSSRCVEWRRQGCVSAVNVSASSYRVRTYAGVGRATSREGLAETLRQVAFVSLVSLVFLQYGYQAGTLHGGQDQTDREFTIQEFQVSRVSSSCFE